MGYALKQNGKTVRDHWGKQIVFDTLENAEGFLEGGNKFVGQPPPGCTVEKTDLKESGNWGGASFPDE